MNKAVDDSWRKTGAGVVVCCALVASYLTYKWYKNRKEFREEQERLKKLAKMQEDELDGIMIELALKRELERQEYEKNRKKYNDRKKSENKQLRKNLETKRNQTKMVQDFNQAVLKVALKASRDQERADRLMQE